MGTFVRIMSAYLNVGSMPTPVRGSHPGLNLDVYWLANKLEGEKIILEILFRNKHEFLNFSGDFESLADVTMGKWSHVGIYPTNV